MKKYTLKILLFLVLMFLLPPLVALTEKALPDAAGKLEKSITGKVKKNIGKDSIRVDLNHATLKELTFLKGVGKKKAQRILEFRTRNGPYKMPEDLMKVRGFGKKSVKKLLQFISVNGKTTALQTTSVSIKTEKVPHEKNLKKKVNNFPEKSNSETSPAGVTINVNTAGLKEPMKIKGIGKVSARRIIEYRKVNGPFRKVENLTEVKGIGAVTLKKIGPFICVR